MLSYYRNNSALLFYKDAGFVNNIRLEDIENMYPYERDIYIILFKDYMKSHQKSGQQGG
jgi:hypothetical protein